MRSTQHNQSQEHQKHIQLILTQEVCKLAGGTKEKNNQEPITNPYNDTLDDLPPLDPEYADGFDAAPIDTPENSRVRDHPSGSFSINLRCNRVPATHPHPSDPHPSDPHLQSIKHTKKQQRENIWDEDSFRILGRRTRTLQNGQELLEMKVR